MKFKEFYNITENENDFLKNKAKSYNSAEEFLKSQYTGFISSKAYEDETNNYNTDINDAPKLIHKMEIKNGETVEFRQSNEKLKYIKTDKNNSPLRDERDNLIYLSDKEIKEKNIPLYDTTLYVFNDKGENVGFASDEWGADGVWVKSDYQRQGIGTELLIQFKKQFNDPNRKIGQMTPAGMNMTRSYWRKLTGKSKPDINELLDRYKKFLKKFKPIELDPDKYTGRNYDYDNQPNVQAYNEFEKTLNPDERVVLSQYFYPEDYKQQITPEEFYERNK